MEPISPIAMSLTLGAGAIAGKEVEHGTFVGDIDIKGVRAGVTPGDPPKGN